MTSISCQSEPQIASRQTSGRKLEKREEATHAHVKNQFVEVWPALGGRVRTRVVESCQLRSLKHVLSMEQL